MPATDIIATSKSYHIPPTWKNRFVYQRNGEYALLDPLSLESVFLSPEEMNVLLNGGPKSQILEEYLNNSNCRDRHYTDRDSIIRFLKQRLDEFGLPLEPNRISGYRIILTDRCNMRCSYCFVDTNTGKPDLTKEELETGLRFLFRHNEGQDEVTIQWFGGEPTLRFDLIKYGDNLSTALAKEYGIARIQRTVVTNGIHLTRDMLEHFERLGYGVGVSIDGPPAVNHEHRALLSGKDYSSRLKANLNRLHNMSNIYLGANLTPTVENIDCLNEAVDYIISELDLKFIYINNPIPTSGNWFVPGARLAEAIFHARIHALSKGAIVHSVLDRVYQALDARIPKILEEVDGSITAALLPGGKVSLSDLFWSDQSVVYTLAEIMKITPPLSQSAKKLLPSPECLRCPAVAICGGPPKSHTYFSHSNTPDPDLCALYRKSIELAIWDTTGLQ